MGCCSSSTAKTPPPDEETIVKEVLSETPISKPPPQRDTHIPHSPPSQLPQTSISTPINYNAITTAHQQSNPPPPLPDNNAFESNPTAKTNHTNTFSTHQQPPSAGVNRRKAESKEEKTPQVSQTSEISSATTTTTVTEIRDDEVTSKKRVSPGKLQTKRPYRAGQPRRERPVNGGVRREVSRGVNRDIGEASARRSRSPATRVAGGGVGKGRGVGRVTGEVGNRLVEKKEENGGVSGEEQASESLENPLVSLECFIFL